MKKKIFIVIPAYQPETELICLIEQLRQESGYQVIVVDDGSGNEYQSIFEQIESQVVLLNHKKNQGKGAALKTAFRYIKLIEDEGIVVTVDADGQHSITDMKKVIKNAAMCPHNLTIGSRTFSQEVPLRSAIGNKLTRKIFQMVTGLKIQDTQTGLRAFHTNMIPWVLTIEGERYEYEMNVLIQCSKQNIVISEVEIQTIYLNQNSASHFRVIRDSIRIYGSIFKFMASSFICFLFDYLVFTIVVSLMDGWMPQVAIPAANITARVFSSSMNFFINRKFVFRNQGDIKKAAIQYFLLTGIVLCGNTMVLEAMTSILSINRFLAKVLTEQLSFIVNWTVQHKIIFKKKKTLTNVRVKLL